MRVLNHLYKDRRNEYRDIPFGSSIMGLDPEVVKSSLKQLKDKGFINYTASPQGCADVRITTEGVDRIEGVSGSGGSVSGGSITNNFGAVGSVNMAGRDQFIDKNSTIGELHLEKNNADSPERPFMERAIELARNCVSEPGRISPSVGAVLVLDGKIIAEAYRGEVDPGEHAEFTLLERKLGEQSASGATLYATLEPCTTRNHPKVPCAHRIIEREVKKVVYGTLDPDPRITGAGELWLREAGVEIARFDSDLITVLEELNRGFSGQHPLAERLKHARVTSSHSAASQDIGPNGFRTSILKNGDKVEWLPDDENPSEEYPLLLRRGDQTVLEEYQEHWDKVWWNRHMVWMQKLESGEETSQGKESVIEMAKKAAQRIEKRYGRDNLGWSDFELGLLSGRMSALSWVMGAEWNESLDT